MQEAVQNPYLFANRAILAPHNDSVKEINERILEKLPGETQTFISVDHVEQDDDDRFQYTVEYLQSCNASGIPNSHLMLKVGAPVLLLRNMNPSQGFCNGTRMIVTRLQRYIIDVRIASGPFKNKEARLPRILINSKESDFGFILQRRQFPVALCFAMSINKAQGQSLPFVGLDLRVDVFSHGQLYVALSRVTNANSLHVLVRNKRTRKVENIVWPSLLLLG
jgi:ATP-dependent DNA helicase PIF1